MTAFYHPYAFIPVTGKVNDREPTTLFADIKNGCHQHIRHDLWIGSARSGRIVCSVSTKTPLLIGKNRTEPDKKTNQSGQVQCYCFNGQYRIPGNSIRGMIASLAETLSQSAMRVLENKTYKVSTTTGKKNVPGSVHSAFKLIGPNVLPWGAKGRTALTSAEALFGVVPDKKLDNSLESTGLASRVRFYNALALQEIVPLSQTTLRILAEPARSVTACMYYSADGVARSKTDIDLRKHRPSGRKYYLHNPNALDSNKTWDSKTPWKNAHQKTKCGLIGPGEVFYFAVDYNNLTEDELGLLYTALAPDERFIHRLGMGKPLGLGSVQISVLGVFEINRVDRYKENGVSDSRYTRALNVSGEWENPGLCKLFPEEAAVSQKAELHKRLDVSKGMVDASTLRRVLALGNPERLEKNVPVHYPITEGQWEKNEYEDKGFLWYSNNEKSGAKYRQCLNQPDDKPESSLPTLKTN